MKQKIFLIAPLSLIIATLGFISTFLLPNSFWTGLLRSFCEAAMVGGLADWFAVTALFRRPLGLPIPHTAIIANKRDQIQDAILSMFNTFLPPERIISHIYKLDLIGAFIGYSSDEKNRERLVRVGTGVIHKILTRIDVSEFSNVLGDVIRLSLKQRIPEMAKGISMFLAANYAKEDSMPERVFQLCIQGLHNFIKSKNSTELLARLIEEALDKDVLMSLLKRFGAIDSHELAQKFISPVSREIELELRKEGNQFREVYKQLYRNLTNQLKDPCSQSSRIVNEWWLSAIAEENIDDFLQNYLNRYRQMALDDLEEESSKIGQFLEQALENFVKNLKTSTEFRNQITDWVNSQLSSLVQSHHGEIGEMVSSTLNEFSNEKLVTWIESKVGGDLQYIRLNGAIVGGLVGLAIHLVVIATQ